MTLSICVLICIHTPCISVTYLIDLNITETTKNRKLFNFFLCFFFFFIPALPWHVSFFFFFGAVSFHHSFHCSINTIEHIFMSHDLLDVYVYCGFFFFHLHIICSPPLFFVLVLSYCASLRRRKLL